MITAEVRNSAEDFNAFYSFWKKERIYQKTFLLHWYFALYWDWLLLSASGLFLNGMEFRLVF